MHKRDLLANALRRTLDLLPAFAAIVLLASCSTPSAIVTPIESISVTLETAEVVAPSDSTATPIPAPFQIISADNMAAKVKFHDWSEHSGENVLLLLSSTTPSPELGQPSLEYLTWDGERGPLLTFDLPPNADIEPERMTGGGNVAILSYNPLIADEYYVIDFSTGRINVLRTGCESTLPMAAGPKFVAFACYRSHTWHLISIDDLSVYKSIFLPIGAPRFFEPFWLDADRLLLREDFSKSVCAIDIRTPDPVCKNIDFWLGMTSPNGRWSSVRAGANSYPDFIGVVSSSCFLDKDNPCTPRLVPLIESIPSLGSGKYLIDAAWSADSSAILFSVGLGINHDTLEYESSEIWRFEVASQDLELLYTLSGEIYFSERYYNLSPSFWSPDGRSVVVADGPNTLLLNIETGTLTPLAEGGIILGAVTLP